jgi:hypothetical protein
MYHIIYMYRHSCTAVIGQQDMGNEVKWARGGNGTMYALAQHLDMTVLKQGDESREQGPHPVEMACIP